MKAVQYRMFRDEVVTHFEAMGAARRAQAERVEASLRRGVSVILTGHSGIGKSYLAASIVKRLGGGPRDRGGDPVIRCGLSRGVQRLRELRDSASDDYGVLTIEDAHLLGVDELRDLVDLVGEAERPLLITMDLHPVELTSPGSLARSHLVTSLWADLGLERVDLSGIGFTEASALIDQVCGDEGVDVVTRARIVHAAAGNPLLVTELTREALQRSGGIGIDNSSLVLGPITLSPRILDLTRKRLAGLSDIDEYALVTLAKIGTVPYVRATRLVGQAPLRSLLRRGLVVHEPGSLEFVSANVLYANAAHAGRGVENPFEAAHAVERLLLVELQGGGRLTSVECVMVAAYWANNASVDPLDTVDRDTAAEIFLRAARRADMWGLPTSVELFARRSLAVSPSVGATEQLSRALAGQGRAGEALDLLERDSLPHSDQYADADMLAWWCVLLSWHNFGAEHASTMHARVSSWGTVDTLLADFDQMVSLVATATGSDYAEGVDDLAAFASDASKIIALRLRALSELVPAYTFLGRHDDLHAAFDLGRDMIGEIAMGGAERQLGDVTTAGALFLANAGLAKAVVGDDRDGVVRDLDVYALRAVLTGNDLELALVNMVSGGMSLASQRAARAEIELANAELGISRKLEPSAAVSSRLLRGNALCALGRRDEARELLRGLAARDVAITPWTEFYARFLEISLIADPADYAPARAALFVLAHFKNGRSRQITVTALFGAFVAGADAAEVVTLLDSIDPPGGSPSADATEEQLRAEIDHDAFRLDAVGDRLERMGIKQQAALAFQSAGAAHLAHGRGAQAAASFLRRDAQDTGRPAAVETAPPVASGESIAKLTRRELEIAQLAGQGLSNSEIASRLFLSVRTVESHVLQARVKLGAARRTELGLYLAELSRQAS